MIKQYDIYSIINLKNGKMYVGQTTQGYRKRFNQHKQKTSGCPLLKKAISKYGKDAFECELLDIAYSEEIANLKEKMWIALLKTYIAENGYNLSLGGKVGCFNKETLRKMSESHKGSKNHFFGKHHSEQAKQKMSEHKKGLYKLANHPKAKPIMCVETGVCYDCAASAGLETGINRMHIAECARNANREKGRRIAGGYHWVWTEKNK